MTVSVEFDPTVITFADLQDAFQKAAQAFQAADTVLLHNGEILNTPNVEALRIRKFSEDMYIISGYKLPDPSKSPVTLRLQQYHQNPLIEAYQTGTYQAIVFQHGKREVVGNTGVTIESLLSICMDRLKSFQDSEYACDENNHALKGLEIALNALNCRMMRVINESYLTTVAEPLESNLGESNED